MLTSLSNLHLLKENIHSYLVNAEKTECIYYIQCSSNYSFRTLYLVHAKADRSEIYSIAAANFLSWVASYGSYYCTLSNRRWTPPTATVDMGESVSFWYYVRQAIETQSGDIEAVQKLRERIKLLHYVDVDSSHTAVVQHTVAIWIDIRKLMRAKYELPVPIYPDIEDQVACYYRTVGGYFIEPVMDLIDREGRSKMFSIGQESDMYEILGRIMSLVMTPKYQQEFFHRELYRTIVHTRNILDLDVFKDCKERLGGEKILALFNLLSNPLNHWVNAVEVV